MPVVAPALCEVSPTTIAALLLVAIGYLRALELPCPSASEVLRCLDVSRGRAYELRDRLRAVLDDLVGPVGRPRKPDPEPAPPALATEVLRYVTAHPGCIAGSGRRRYSDGLRHFVLDLLHRHKDIPLDAIAHAITIPLGTLKDWLAGGAIGVEVPGRAFPSQPDVQGPQIQTLLVEWRAWEGSFIDFCDHVQINCRIPFGRTLIAETLEAAGERVSQRRGGRGPDEKSLRDAFETFFPHAQWVGDGSLVPVEVGGERFVFNLELGVDPCSGAFVGAGISDVEDGDAVVDAFEDAIASTGARPIALLLDNKPCNLTDAVAEAVADTFIIRATPGRGQNKAHCEGAFGLLKPSLAGLQLHVGETPRDLARSFLRALVIAFCRGINHKPRKDRKGRSRAELQAERPSDDEIEQARAALLDRRRRQELARQTRAARLDPIVRSRLAEAYARLGFDDPTGNILDATARYSLDAVVEAIAIFEARQRTGRNPDGAAAAYLLGIARNIDAERATWELAEALLAERIAARDEIIDKLDRRRDHINDDVVEPDDLIAAYIDRATSTRSRLERFWWLVAAADAINDEDDAEHRRLFRLAARRIASTHALARTLRDEAVRFLAAKVVPLN